MMIAITADAEPTFSLKLDANPRDGSTPVLLLPPLFVSHCGPGHIAVVVVGAGAIGRAEPGGAGAGELPPAGKVPLLPEPDWVGDEELEPGELPPEPVLGFEPDVPVPGELEPPLLGVDDPAPCELPHCGLLDSEPGVDEPPPPPPVAGLVG
jgi:hypothetical protein